MKIRRLLRIAESIAREELPYHRENYKHWTFVVHDGRLVGWGTNRSGTPNLKGYHSNAKIHSEIRALSSYQGDTIINVRLTKAGKLGEAKPCPVCKGWLKALGVKEVYYSTRGGFVKDTK